MGTTYSPASESKRVIVEQNGYRYPPGLKLNLPFYLLRRFFRPGNPIALFEYLTEKYGSMAHYRLGASHIVLVSEPEFIQEILINQPQHFIKERTQRRMKILLGEGLITSDGEVHKRQRRIAAPAFHRQRIQAYGSIMADRAAHMRAQWQPHQPIDIASQMMALALQVVARTLFNTDVTADVLEINHQVNVIMHLYNYLIALPRAEAYLHWPVPGLIRFRRARATLDKIVHRMISEHRADGKDRGDLLSMLLASRDDEADHSGMSDEQLRDEVLTIFLAGYETVANALTWTWYLLSQNPDAEEKMHREIDAVLAKDRLPTVEDLSRLRYTEMVFAESMRLYPPAWAMGRQSTAEVELGPYRFPTGTYFFFSQYIIQRSEKYFPDPLHFDPDRFRPEEKSKRPRFAYFPFGAGSRQCIGEAFAWMEGVLMLATIAQRWRLRFVPGQVVDVQPKITLRPKNPMMFLPEPR
jgi:cytochrome P450